VTVVAVSPLFDLADATVISETQSSGVVDFDIGLSQVTVTEVIDDYVIAKLPSEYSYFARGTVDPTAKYDVQFAKATPLALLRTLCDAARDPTTKRPAELRVRRNGTTGYYIDVLTEINGSAAIPDLRAKKNLRRTSYARSAQQQATKVYPFGAESSDGVPTTVARAAWTLGTPTGLVYPISDPEGGPAVILEDDQLNGYYVVPDGTNPLVQITDSDATAQTVTLASSSGITAGRQSELRADASNTLLTYVQSPSAIATYGTKVGTVERPDLIGVRNLVRNPWFRNWSGGSPVNWTKSGTVTQNTDTLYTQYGGSSAKMVVASNGTARLLSDTIYPRATAGAQFYSLKVRVLFSLFTGTAQFSVYVLGGTIYGSNIIVAPNYPFAGQQYAAVGDWVDMKIQAVDLGLANSTGVQVDLRIDCPNGYCTAYVDAVQLEQQAIPSDVWVEYNGANALWHAGNLALQFNKDPVATYEVELDDLERAGETAFDELAIGSYARLNESALGVTNTLVRIVEKPRINYLAPKDTTIALATKTKLLADYYLLNTSSFGTTTVGVTGGGGGSGTPPGTTTPPTSPPPGTSPPPPTNAIAAVPTRWEIRAQTGSVCLIVDVPSAATEVDTKLRRYVQIGEKHNLTGRVVTAGNSGSYLAVQYFRTSDSTWRYLDGTSGPQLSLTSTGDILGTLVTTEADARGWQLCRLVSAAGDAAADPEFGSLALVGAVAASTSTPPVDIPTDLADLFDALFLSDVDIYSDTALTTPQTTNGNEVRGWRNRVSGATVHGIQSVSTAGPRLDTGTTLGGFQSLRFQSNHNIVFDELMAGTTEGTLFIVLKNTNALVNTALWNAGGNGSDVTYYPNGPLGGPGPGIIVDSALAAPPRHTSVDPSQDLTQGHIYAVRSSSGEWSNWINGVQLYTTASNTYQAGQSNDVTIGVNGSADPYDGYVWLFGMVASALTDDEMAERFEAIATRYGLTI
jgi:hypothetical protein